MLLTRFAQLARGQLPPAARAVRRFKEALEGEAVPGLTPEDFARRLRGERKPKPLGKGTRAFLEGVGPLPHGLKGKRPKWPARQLTESDRRALVGAGRRQGGRHELMESLSQPGVEVGAEPILRNIRVLGTDSLNRRRYTRQAMEDAIDLYSGASVYVDHPEKPTTPRSLKDKIGKLVNCRVDDKGVVGDLVYNPAHPMAATILWWFEHCPDGCGLSHNAIGSGHSEGDTFVVDRIVKVRSVDLVSSPATTAGMV